MRWATKRPGRALRGMRTMTLTLAAAFGLALAASASPGLAQGWLAPLQELGDELAKQIKPPAETRTAPRPKPPTPPARPVVAPPVMEPVAPPIPQPRPDFLDETAAPAKSVEPLPDQPPVNAPAPVQAPETVVTPDTDKLPEPVATEPAEPARIYQTACPALIQGLVEGRLLPPIAEGQCGTQSPLEITAIASRGRMVPLSTPVTTDCAMASALPGWVASVDGYARSMLESPLSQINTGPGYMCRNRNNASDGLVSEHGFANALDISGFTLEDGRTIAVKTSWLPGNTAEGRLLRLAHDAACGSFTTVLGPEANADHADHIHLDLGCHGRTCTALLCQ